MRKIIIMFAVMLLLVSCGNVPQEKYDTAKHCLDSLVDNGAKNSIKYYDLVEKMKTIDNDIQVQNSKLFRKFIDINNELDEVINLSRTFVVTNDRPEEINKIRRGVPLTDPNRIVVNMPNRTVNPNMVRLEVELTFDSEQDALKIATLVDQAVRSNMNLNAKLISVKIIE
jgi:hypothetical protein